MEPTESLFAILRGRFEGREAIYREKGALRVRISNIQISLEQSVVAADVEEIISPGLPVGWFMTPMEGEPRPLRWTILAGFLTEFSEYWWAMGYGGWRLYFDSELVQKVSALASILPEEIDTYERYYEIGQLLRESPEGVVQRRFPEEAGKPAPVG